MRSLLQIVREVVTSDGLAAQRVVVVAAAGDDGDAGSTTSLGKGFEIARRPIHQSGRSQTWAEKEGRAREQQPWETDRYSEEGVMASRVTMMMARKRRIIED